MLLVLGDEMTIEEVKSLIDADRSRLEEIGRHL